MYVPRLSVHTLPGKTHDEEEELKKLLEVDTWPRP